MYITLVVIYWSIHFNCFDIFKLGMIYTSLELLIRVNRYITEPICIPVLFQLRRQLRILLHCWPPISRQCLLNRLPRTERRIFIL